MTESSQDASTPLEVAIAVVETNRPERVSVPCGSMGDLGDETSAAPSARVGGHTSKAERRAARQTVGTYHEEELGKLLERVRDGFARYDAGEVDAFDLDEHIHHYKRSAQKIWSFCTGSAERVAGVLVWMREQGEETDWWTAGEPRRRS